MLGKATGSSGGQSPSSGAGQKTPERPGVLESGSVEPSPSLLTLLLQKKSRPSASVQSPETHHTGGTPQCGSLSGNSRGTGTLFCSREGSTVGPNTSLPETSNAGSVNLPRAKSGGYLQPSNSLSGSSGNTETFCSVGSVPSSREGRFVGPNTSSGQSVPGTLNAGSVSLPSAKSGGDLQPSNSLSESSGSTETVCSVGSVLSSRKGSIVGSNTSSGLDDALRKHAQACNRGQSGSFDLLAVSGFDVVGSLGGSSHDSECNVARSLVGSSHDSDVDSQDGLMFEIEELLPNETGTPDETGIPSI